MGRATPHNSGYTLIELLVVLAILGILALVGINSLGNRQATAVRSLMDEFEGSLVDARKVAGGTGRDIAVTTWGDWSVATPLAMAYGDAGISDANIQATANLLLTSQPVDTTLANVRTVAVPFHLQINGTSNTISDVIHTRARVVVVGAESEWATAMTATASGTVNGAITAGHPFQAGDAMADLLKDAAAVKANNLFDPTLTGGLKRIVISGANQRFASNFIIEIVGTSPSGGPTPGAAMGLIVGLANGASIYKFYNPGIVEGNGQWRRI